MLFSVSAVLSLFELLLVHDIFDVFVNFDGVWDLTYSDLSVGPRDRVSLW